MLPARAAIWLVYLLDSRPFYLTSRFGCEIEREVVAIFRSYSATPFLDKPCLFTFYGALVSGFNKGSLL